MSNLVKIVGVFGFIVFLIALGPWLTIWAWNVLFGNLHHIEFGFETWAAVVLLGAFLRANVSVKRKD